MARPSHTEPMTRKGIALPDTTWEAVSEYRHGERIPSETEAIRRLVQIGLDTEAKRSIGKEKR